jgi:hypothetical protein
MADTRTISPFVLIALGGWLLYLLALLARRLSP